MVLYEVWARVWLRRLAREAGRPMTLADVPDDALDALPGDAVWLMGVWQLGPAGLPLSRALDHSTALPSGLREDDVTGSPYAVADYRVARDLGGEPALARLRRRLRARGKALWLDLVPNHTARDCGWVSSHPDRYVQGWPGAEVEKPTGYWLAETALGPRALAHGRDPFFPPWTDTVQLDARLRDTRRALADTVRAIGRRADGARCDMAMLLLRDVFAKTWGERPRWPPEEPAAGEAWEEILAARRPGFTLAAEAYWGREDDLLRLGFDRVYDKGLYDALVAVDARAVRRALGEPPDGQARRLRFLENHDEPRAGALPWPHHRAAATIVALAPGDWLLHDGQLDGRKIRPHVHLGRWEDEPADPVVRAEYEHLLRIRCGTARSRGAFRLFETDGALVAFAWEAGRDRLAVAVNFGGRPWSGHVDGWPSPVNLSLAPWEVLLAGT